VHLQQAGNGRFDLTGRGLGREAIRTGLGFGRERFAPAAFRVTAGQDQAWPAIGHFFTTLSSAGLTGVFAALAVVLLAGGYATMRRVTV
jgi:hypothetical protein